jgi:hypothetical protein
MKVGLEPILGTSVLAYFIFHVIKDTYCVLLFSLGS